MPYPLPDGDSYEETLRWFLVAVPDRPEYVTAGLGAYTEFGNRYLWGKEGPTDESENAAQSWHLAIAATLEALEMGFPDILLGHIDDVETLLKAIRDTQCCTPGGGSVTSTSGDLVIDPIGVSADEPPLDLTDPTTWPPDYETDPTGQTAFPDLAAISDNLCRAANAIFVLFLDFLVVAGWFAELKYSLSSLLHEVTQLALAKLFPTATGQAIAFSYEAISSANDADWLALDKAAVDTARAEIETAQNDIVCAWANANTYTEALSASAAIISASVTSSTVSAWIIGGGLLGFAVALLFRLWADPLDYSCDCEQAVSQVSYTWDTDAEGWLSDLGADPYSGTDGNPAGCLLAEPGHYAVSPLIRVEQFVSFSITVDTKYSQAASLSCLVEIRDASDALIRSVNVNATDTWTTRNATSLQAGPFSEGNYRIRVYGGAIRQIKWDNMTVDFNS